MKHFFLAVFLIPGFASTAQSHLPMDTVAINFFTAAGIRVDTTLLPMYSTICDWMDAPYQYGGNTREGTDCSSLVKAIYRDSWGMVLSGTSSTMYQQYDSCNASESCSGDLVFFAINGRDVSHVGIYLGSDAFVHASTHRGVIISYLDERYYHIRFAGSVPPEALSESEKGLCNR